MSYFKGKRISQAIKRASRIGTESQETIPSLNTKISGIYATAIATASECPTPASAYALAAIETGLTLKSRGYRGDAHRLAALLLLGRQLGDLKTSPYAPFCVIGLNDTATAGISVLNTLRENKSDFGQLWASMEKTPIRLGTLNWEQLFKDPFSLPFRRPKDADTHQRACQRHTARGN